MHRRHLHSPFCESWCCMQVLLTLSLPPSCENWCPKMEEITEKKTHNNQESIALHQFRARCWIESIFTVSSALLVGRLPCLENWNFVFFFLSFFNRWRRQISLGDPKKEQPDWIYNCSILSCRALYRIHGIRSHFLWRESATMPQKKKVCQASQEFHDVNYYLNTESIKKKKITILFALISLSSFG